MSCFAEHVSGKSIQPGMECLIVGYVDTASPLAQRPCFEREPAVGVQYQQQLCAEVRELRDVMTCLTALEAQPII